MTRPKEQMYKLIPEWTIRQVEASLIITGGADAKYEIELERDSQSYFSTLKSNQPFARSVLSTDDQRLLEQLVTAEIVVPVLKSSRLARVKLIGDKCKGLSLAKSRSFIVVPVQESCDIALLVRTASTYANLLSKVEYQEIIGPHLFVDMAFHHTLSIGPLVFPGETACVACLQGRIGVRWGDETPPESPRVAGEYLGVAAEIITVELNKIIHGDTSLTNKTCVWNFQDRAIRINQLLKVPLCPVCTRNRIDPTGALALTWGRNDENPANAI